MQYNSLYDICHLKQWKTIPNKELINEGYPVYGANGIIGYYYEYNHKNETILLGCRGTCGSVHISKPFSYINGNALCLDELSDSYRINYVYYFLKSLDYSKIISGTRIPQITQINLKDVKIPKISLDKQDAISSELESINELIEKYKYIFANYDNIVKSQFIEMFGEPFSPKEGIELKTFKDVCIVHQGLQIPISKRLKSKEENCYTYITIQYVNGKKEVEYIKNPNPSVVCSKEDILMTRTGNTGQVITDVEGVFHNNFFIVEYDKKIYNRLFLLNLLKREDVRQEFLKRATTSTIPDLSHDKFYSCPVMIPKMELQNQFANFVQQIDKSKLNRGNVSFLMT